MSNLLVWLALALLPAAPADASPPVSAEAILERCLARHDPNDVWSSRALTITARVVLAERLADDRGYSTRTDRIDVDIANGRFGVRTEREGHELEFWNEGDSFEARLNGTTEISDADREAHRLTPDGMARTRDYFTYMYGLPMKLRDPGTRLDPVARRTTFAGRDALALRVTYSPEVGKDIWYFYVEPDSFEMIGCRFFHDEGANDGEYIVFEGEVEGPDGLRLPRTRLWHMNRDGEYIATDEVLSVLPGEHRAR